MKRERWREGETCIYSTTPLYWSVYCLPASIDSLCAFLNVSSTSRKLDFVVWKVDSAVWKPDCEKSIPSYEKPIPPYEKTISRYKKRIPLHQEHIQLHEKPIMLPTLLPHICNEEQKLPIMLPTLLPHICNEEQKLLIVPSLILDFLPTRTPISNLKLSNLKLKQKSNKTYQFSFFWIRKHRRRWMNMLLHWKRKRKREIENS